MGRIKKIKFRGAAKIGSSVTRAGIHNWNSPADPLSTRSLGKNKHLYQKKFLNYYGLPETAHDPNYFRSIYERGIVYESGIKSIENPSTDNTKIDYSLLYDSYEHISGSCDATNQDIDTGTYKLSLSLNGSTKTTRPIHYYASPDDIKYVIDNDIGQDIFEVSTIGNLDFSNYGPYFIQGKNIGPNNGQTGLFSISDQSNATYISGYLTGYDATSTTTSSQLLKFEKTGIDPHSATYMVTGLDPNYKYTLDASIQRQDLGSNIPFISGITGIIPPQSGITHLSGTFSWVSPPGSICHLKSIGLKKYINYTDFRYSGLNSYTPDSEVYITGYITGQKLLRIADMDFSYNCPNLNLDLPNSSFNENYFFLGGPNFFTGNKRLQYKNISITGNSSLTGFFIHNNDQVTTKICSKIDLSNNSNLKYFYASDHCFPQLRHLNLSGCSLASHNSGVGDYSGNYNGFVGTPSGEFFFKSFKETTMNSLSYLNLYGNDLNRTGIRGWIFSCITSYHYPNLGGGISGGNHSGYLNIKNQSDPTSVFSESNNDLTNRQVLSGISILSGKGWIVDYDK